MHCLLQVSNDIKNITYLYCLLVLYCFSIFFEGRATRRRRLPKGVHTPADAADRCIGVYKYRISTETNFLGGTKDETSSFDFITPVKPTCLQTYHVCRSAFPARPRTFYGPRQANLKNQIRMPSYTTIAKTKLLV